MARKQSQNHLLASLPLREFRRIAPHLLPYSTKAGEEMHQRTGSSPYVYFPINSVSSLVITLADGSMVEAATVGNEGMVGLPLFVESESVSIQAFTHVPGNGLKMPRSVLRAELKRELSATASTNTPRRFCCSSRSPAPATRCTASGSAVRGGSCCFTIGWGTRPFP